MTTETRVLRSSETEFDRLVANARRIFADELLPKLAGTHDGAYVVVDGRSGDYEVGDGRTKAETRLRLRQPNAVTFSAGIGMEPASEKWRDWIVSWVRSRNAPNRRRNQPVGTRNHRLAKARRYPCSAQKIRHARQRKTALLARG